MKTQTGKRVIARLFLQLRRQIGVGVQRHAPVALPSGKRPSTNRTGSWVFQSILDDCVKSRYSRDAIPGPSSSQRVAIQIEYLENYNLPYR